MDTFQQRKSDGKTLQLSQKAALQHVKQFVSIQKNIILGWLYVAPSVSEQLGLMETSHIFTN